MTTVGITSHRKFTAADMGKARRAIKSLIENPNVERILFGGAIGLDTICLEAALEFRTTPSKPELVVIVPNRIQHQPRQAQRAIHRADTVLELGLPITLDDGYRAYKVRNTKIVEASDVIVALWNEDPQTGTGHAVGVAKKMGKKVIIVKVTGRYER
jgi:uncharacterized phage-like protein YoqJ